MSTLERILESLEKLKTKHILEGNYERAAEIKVVIDKIKKRFKKSKTKILNNYLNDTLYPEYPDRQEINDHLDVIKDNLDDIKEVVNK